MALFYSSVPVSHDSVTVSQHAQYYDPDTEAAKENSAIINLIWSHVKKRPNVSHFHVRISEML